MRIETHGADRKLIAHAISEHLGEPATYSGMPRCVYTIGPVTVERDGAITSENADAWASLMPFFDASGWGFDAKEQLAEHAGTTACEAEHVDSECRTVNYGLPAFPTPAGFINFIKCLYSHQKLINAMFKEERLRIDDETITLLKDTFPDSVEKAAEVVHEETRLGFNKGIDVEGGILRVEIPNTESPTGWVNYAELLNTVYEKTHTARHACSRVIEPEGQEMKYFCHSWLLSLGFGGPDYKDLRAALLNHLPGYAAFRNAELMFQHKIKYDNGHRRVDRPRRGENRHEENR